MKQLAGLDELFLALERPNQCVHVAVLGIYDPGSAPGGRVRLRDIMTHMSQRLDVLPVFRRRLVPVPLDLDRAYWVDDARVDLEYHVRHIALPKPGDWRQLCIQVARLHSQPLDRAKPLWQAYVIEGLDNVEGVAPGSFAVYIKFHQAAIEGEASAQILRAMHSLISVPEHHAPGKPPVVEAPPTAVELYARTWGNVVPRGVRLWHAVATATLKLTSLASEALYKRFSSGSVWADDFRDGLGWPRQAQSSRFAGAVSSRRVVEGVGLDMAGVHQIRKWTGGAAVNDVFLAILGGALRRYQATIGEPLDAEFGVGVASAARDTLPGGEVSRLSLVRVRVFAEIAQPLARLRAIRHEAAERRQTADVLGRPLMLSLADELPTQMTTTLLQRLLPDYINALAGAVRGPDVPLYFAGAQLKRFYPIGAVIDGVGLNVAGFCYCDQLWISIVSCRKMLPDPDVFARCLRESFDEMWAVVRDEEAAQATMVEARPARAGKSKPGRRSRRGVAVPARTREPVRPITAEGAESPNLPTGSTLQ